MIKKCYDKQMKNLPKLLIILFFSFFSYELLADSNKKKIAKYKGNVSHYKESRKVLKSFFNENVTFNYGGNFSPEIRTSSVKADDECIDANYFEQPSQYDNYRIEPIYSLELKNGILQYSISKFEKDTDKVKSEVKKLGYVKSIQQPYRPVKSDPYGNLSQTLDTLKFIIYLSEDIKSKNYNKALQFKFENSFTSIVYERSDPTSVIGFPVGTKFWACSWTDKIKREIFVMHENNATQNRIVEERVKKSAAADKAYKEGLRKKLQNDAEYSQRMKSQCKQIRDKITYGGKKESYWIMTPIFEECKTLGLM
jgi:hypothetical protein